MNIYQYPETKQWAEICRRPHLDYTQLNSTVAGILSDVRQRGDEAVRQYEAQFDHAELEQLAVSKEEFDEAESQVSSELKDAIRLAWQNIYTFHSAQLHTADDVLVQPGVRCWQRLMPIDKVGLYVPGGTAPLFSTVLMLATPAVIAGCPEVVLCTPPMRDGRVNAAVLVAARQAGVKHVYKVGGVQAIGAMAYGTETVPKVYKIFGPGNQYVMAAKQQVSLADVAIDMPAGPSEVCVIADAHANAAFVAADLLSQAEHGIDSQVMLITTSEDMLTLVRREIDRQIEQLPRKEIARQSLGNSRLVVVSNSQQAIDLANTYAPEHLILQTDDYHQLVWQVRNAGSVFLGPWATESAGDYASGTNHTLPTHGHAVSYGGVALDSFCHRVTFQELHPEGIEKIGPAVVAMAEAEGLEAHAQAMRVRMEELRAEN
ncbi:MAG: histidinol dehydrogenase [Prevotella sp.]|nr:histidinol dehydrogenase [Prevotella sp.]